MSLGLVPLCFVAAVTLAPTAEAAPCTAGGLAATASGVLGAAGGYLDGIRAPTTC